MNRRQNFQTIAWFYDLKKRKMLNLDPPYQRRSVWPNSFKEYFIDTILLNYPAPTIFLFEEIDPKGTVNYNVVDGKQRLTTVFDFISGSLGVGNNATMVNLRGRSFAELDDEIKFKFWSYTFSVEYLPSRDETTINSIFDRINRNVAKLTAQELRHAKFSGEFISSCEEMANWFYSTFPRNFPQIAPKTRSQMKDIEFIAQILLLIEEGPKGYDTDSLDSAFSVREDVWPEKEAVLHMFKEISNIIKSVIEYANQSLQYTRFRNQADLYSLFGAIKELINLGRLPDIPILHEKLSMIANSQSSEQPNSALQEYFELVRASSNKTHARKERQRILTDIIQAWIEENIC